MLIDICHFVHQLVLCTEGIESYARKCVVVGEQLSTKCENSEKEYCSFVCSTNLCNSANGEDNQTPNDPPTNSAVDLNSLLFVLLCALLYFI